jgi:uncharacterized tellurite resistance protein B-like protein
MTCVIGGSAFMTLLYLVNEKRDMDYRVFYAELGKLLYAVADADGIISPREKQQMYDMIRSRLTHREIHTDEFGTNDAWYAMFEFEVAEEQAMDPDEAFQSFSDFLDERGGEMDEDTRVLCLTLADRLAESYRHTNRKEEDLIRKLREKLFSLPVSKRKQPGQSGMGHR